MSKRSLLTLVAIIPTAWVWNSVVADHGGLRAALAYAPAGIAATIALVWITRRFAMLGFSWRIAALSTLVGVFYTTPIITVLLGNISDTTGSSAVVIGLTASAIAAILGALWGVAGSAGDALAEWRTNHTSPTRRLKFGGLHR